MSGFWGTKLVNDTCLAADWVLGLGTRFKEADCSSWYRNYTFNIPPTRLIHIDIEPSEIGRNFATEIGAVADLKEALSVLLQVARETVSGTVASPAEIAEQIAASRREFAADNEAMATSDAFPMMPERILAEVRAQLPRDAIITTDVGWNKNGVGQQFPIYTPGSVLTPGGFATMGFGPPAAIGAKIARPTGPCISLVGDGGFGQNPAALATAVEHKLAIVWLVMNNNAYGTIAGLQKAAYGLTHGTLFPVAEGSWNEQKPNYADIARAYGCEGERLKSAADLAPALRRALSSGKPYRARRADEEQPDAHDGPLEHPRHLRARQAARARSDRLSSNEPRDPRQRSGAARRAAEHQDDHAAAGEEGVDHGAGGQRPARDRSRQLRAGAPAAAARRHCRGRRARTDDPASHGSGARTESSRRRGGDQGRRPQAHDSVLRVRDAQPEERASHARADARRSPQHRRAAAFAAQPQIVGRSSKAACPPRSAAPTKAMYRPTRWCGSRSSCAKRAATKWASPIPSATPTRRRSATSWCECATPSASEAFAGLHLHNTRGLGTGERRRRTRSRRGYFRQLDGRHRRLSFRAGRDRQHRHRRSRVHAGVDGPPHRRRSREAARSPQDPRGRGAQRRTVRLCAGGRPATRLSRAASLERA